MVNEEDMKKLIKQAQAVGFHHGYISALRLFAWWKDGEQYVGCGNKTLGQAMEEFDRAFIESDEKRKHV